MSEKTNNTNTAKDNKKTTKAKDSNKNTDPKKDLNKKTAPKNKKVNPLQKENETLKKKTFNLEMQVLELKSEIEIANKTFLSKVETLQKEAQVKISEFKENYKQNSDEEISHIKKYAGSKFFTEFIEPLLNMELAIQAGKNQDDSGVKNYVIGFEMLLKQIEGILRDSNVEKILPKVGDAFNPETMVALQVVEDKENADKIINTKKPGYKMHDRVLKPASVIIGK
ncbi:MAG: nucleotide exchange factor GrpE [Mycoplasma sp.]|nr:nucleotide exchange factor GrpE [Mycoplasma sp.]